MVLCAMFLFVIYMIISFDATQHVLALFDEICEMKYFIELQCRTLKNARNDFRKAFF